MSTPVEEGSASEGSGPSYVSQDLLAGDVETRNTFPLVAVVLGGLIGSAIAFVLHILFTTASTTIAGPAKVSEFLDVVEVPAEIGTQLRVRYGGDKVTQANQLSGRRLLASARAALAAQKGDAAIEELENCIKLSDLADCHLELGLVLVLFDDSAGYAHLNRYLALQDDPDDAENDVSVRRLVDTTRTIAPVDTSTR